jgi:hypothetical protein
MPRRSPTLAATREQTSHDVSWLSVGLLSKREAIMRTILLSVVAPRAAASTMKIVWPERETTTTGYAVSAARVISRTGRCNGARRHHAHAPPHYGASRRAADLAAGLNGGSSCIGVEASAFTQRASHAGTSRSRHCCVLVVPPMREQPFGCDEHGMPAPRGSFDPNATCYQSAACQALEAA